MAKKLYVGSLPYSVNETQLRELFEPFGAIDSVKIISDKFTGKSKGFGFVEMSDDAAADQAVESVNGRELEGRTLIVNEARPEQPRGDRGGRGGFGGGRGRGGFGGGGGGGGGRGGFGGGGRGGDRGGRSGGGGNRW